MRADATRKLHSNGDFEVYNVGFKNVISIEYHQPQGEGDSHYCDITFEVNGMKAMRRLFKPDSVDFSEVE